MKGKNKFRSKEEITYTNSPDFDVVLCDRCKTPMEMVEEKYENMTEGQMADYEAGLWRNFFCPTCKKIEIKQGNFFTGVDEDPADDETANRVITGIIGELWYRAKLRNSGYFVDSIMIYSREKGHQILNMHGIKKVLNKTTWENASVLLELFRSFREGFPDLICLKDEKISFFEIKTNSAAVREPQKLVFKKLQKLGFDVNIIRLNVTFGVNEK